MRDVHHDLAVEGKIAALGQHQRVVGAKEEREVLAQPSCEHPLQGFDPAVQVGQNHLDRPQLVTRAGGNQMVLADLDSWVEPLQGMFARVLGENLALLLGTDDVLMLPQRRDVTLDRQVEVDVTRFDVDDAGNAVLDARWWVYGRNGEKLLRSGRSTISEPAAAGDYTSTAAALSRALGAISEEIAQAIADQART